jgi:hypothetical protein
MVSILSASSGDMFLIFLRDRTYLAFKKLHTRWFCCIRRWRPERSREEYLAHGVNLIYEQWGLLTDIARCFLPALHTHRFCYIRLSLELSLSLCVSGVQFPLTICRVIEARDAIPAACFDIHGAPERQRQHMLASRCRPLVVSFL